MKMQSILAKTLITVCASIQTQYAHANEWLVIFDCGSSSGYRVEAKDGNFSKDGISKGRFQLVRRENEYDLRIVDGLNRMFSAREDGAAVIGRETGDGGHQIFAYYPRPNIETYLFSSPVKNKSRFISTSVKSLNYTSGGTLFTGECTPFSNK